RYATRVTFGATRFTNSSHLLAIEGSKLVKPVRLPPGRAKLWTTPAVSGSLTWTNTVGVVRVVSLTAIAIGVVLAKITSEPRGSTNRAACWRTGAHGLRRPHSRDRRTGYGAPGSSLGREGPV